ncbi:MAG: tRNA uridine-5-carboxymethylaminomethyl(34) synthesis GTPase MnmE [Verrucomicrobiales bacterium VVV1]|nr:MAG: tRNA uridine-5-carboxymethylaminomethyl(34) synthesis GTPase MnmE [Verrucomicrobiales bacterium VVV1]
MDDSTAALPTIAAVATPAGIGAVSLIRLSGPNAIEIADRVTLGKASAADSRVATWCRVRAEDGSVLDDGLLTVFRAPNSYTGEESVEFCGHGGLLVTREVLSRFLACGALPAGPGEFTQRAFLNGKLDLTQAEGVMDLISAQTHLALRAAREQLEGAIGRRTLAARDEILSVLAHVEAYIDFPDEDISPETGRALCDRLATVNTTIARLLATSDQGRILREGVRTVIFGPPNVGKSSLLNRLLGHERAIVSEVAGTTRDTIEELINLAGIPLRLIDTAGIREAGDRIEEEGIRRTVRQIESADLLLEIVDASVGKSQPLVADLSDRVRRLLILNKSDLREHPDWSGVEGIRLSCESGEGFEQLESEIAGILHLGEADWGDHAVAINARHQACLERSQTALSAAIGFLQPGRADSELAARDLRDALEALGEVVGRIDTEDLLGVIFSSFCIGK